MMAMLTIRGQLMGLETLFLQTHALLADAGGFAPHGEKKARVYRAMHVKGVFRAGDVAALAECSAGYVSGLARDLVRAGYLEEMGKRSGRAVFRVRHRDRFYREMAQGTRRRAHGERKNGLAQRRKGAEVKE